MGRHGGTLLSPGRGRGVWGQLRPKLPSAEAVRAGRGPSLPQCEVSPACLQPLCLLLLPFPFTGVSPLNLVTPNSIPHLLPRESGQNPASWLSWCPPAHLLRHSSCPPKGLTLPAGLWTPPSLLSPQAPLSWEPASPLSNLLLPPQVLPLSSPAGLPRPLSLGHQVAKCSAITSIPSHPWPMLSAPPLPELSPLLSLWPHLGFQPPACLTASPSLGPWPTPLTLVSPGLRWGPLPR